MPGDLHEELTEQADETPDPPAGTDLPQVLGKAINFASLGELLQSISPGGAQTDEAEELVSLFLDETLGLIGQFDTLWAKQDLDTLRRHAHSLKSSCAMMGAENLSELCITLEKTLKIYLAGDEAVRQPGDLAAAPQLMAQITAEFALVRQDLKSNLEN